jgi:hypothetical protein
MGCFVYDSCAEKYNRTKHFGNGWVDFDNDGQDTRQEVLIRDSLVPVGFDSNGKVNYGLWSCPYTGTISANPSDFDIDHFIPLKEIYESGADKWNKDKRISYANYLLSEKHLLVTTAGSNRQKGAKDIAYWLPLLEEDKYILNWVFIKEKWNLCFDKEEIWIIRKKFGETLLPEKVCN